MKRMARAAAAIAMTVAVALTGCGSNKRDAADGKLRVVTAFYPLAYASQRVGGDNVWVINLTPAGVEPHDLELNSDTVDTIENADLAVVMGRHFQPAVEKAANRRTKPTVTVLNVLLGDDPAYVGDSGPDHEPGGLDPHVWLDPALMVKVAEALRNALSESDAANAATYRANAAALSRDFVALDGEFRSGLRDCTRHAIITSHEAFGRIAARYGLRQESIAGIVPDQEPDPARLAALAQQVKEDGITTVFFEALTPKAVAETVAREAGVKTAVLSPLEGRSNAETAKGADYFSVMRTNLAALRAALDCR